MALYFLSPILGPEANGVDLLFFKPKKVLFYFHSTHLYRTLLQVQKIIEFYRENLKYCTSYINWYSENKRELFL